MIFVLSAVRFFIIRLGIAALFIILQQLSHAAVVCNFIVSKVQLLLRRHDATTIRFLKSVVLARVPLYLKIVFHFG